MGTIKRQINNFLNYRSLTENNFLLPIWVCHKEAVIHTTGTYIELAPHTTGEKKVTIFAKVSQNTL